MNFLAGFKTLAFGLATAIVPAAVTYIGGVDFVGTFGLSPVAGGLIGAAIIALRAVTSTPILNR